MLAWRHPLHSKVLFVSQEPRARRKRRQLHLAVAGSGLLGSSVSGLAHVRLRALLSLWTWCRMDSAMRIGVGETCGR